MADSLTSRLSLIAGRTPAGSVSVRLVMKTAVASASSADIGNVPGRAGARDSSVRSVLSVAMPGMLKPSHKCEGQRPLMRGASHANW
ncbi:hypothetical protein Asi03nite_03200 [Actinoplanes siamensis]|uniref:Uncharacterized protein n=1 Tax=Actinoplanes siamensis TaxID=1223317 RepID=A0A919K880_9ACTN|nr:hypothetical protein Asi03nite_03200 [Actinoplanes siamensis]